MINKPDKSISIVLKFAETLKIVGYEKVDIGLDKIKNDEDHLNDMGWNFLIGQVCKCFHTSKKKLLEGKTKGVRTDALMISYQLCHIHFNYSLRDLQRKFDKDSSVISRALDAFKKLDPNWKPHAKLLEKHSKLNIIILEFLNSEKRLRA